MEKRKDMVADTLEMGQKLKKSHLNELRSVDANIRKLSEVIAHKCKLNKHVIIIIITVIIIMFAVLIITVYSFHVFSSKNRYPL